MDAASSLGCEVGAIVKSLLFKTENNFILCLVAGDKKASLNKIKKVLNLKDVSMASAEEVKEYYRFYNRRCITYWSFKKVDILYR